MEEFCQNEIVLYAVLKALENIGEVVKQVSEEKENSILSNGERYLA